jgi:hypothetical protein
VSTIDRIFEANLGGSSGGGFKDPFVRQFQVAGSSHASKNSMCLRELGQTANLIYSPNWRAFKNSSLELADKIRDQMDKTPVDCLVLSILDNNIYFALPSGGDGVPIPESKALYGKYHVDGDLVVCGKSQQLVLFNNIRPILDATGGKNVLLVGPLPRYVISTCCGDEEHGANTKMPGFEKQLAAELKDVVANFKE